MAWDKLDIQQTLKEKLADTTLDREETVSTNQEAPLALVVQEQKTPGTDEIPVKRKRGRNRNRRRKSSDVRPESIAAVNITSVPETEREQEKDAAEKIPAIASISEDRQESTLPDDVGQPLPISEVSQTRMPKPPVEPAMLIITPAQPDAIVPTQETSESVGPENIKNRDISEN